MEVKVSYEVEKTESNKNKDRFREETILLGDRKRSGKTGVLRAELVGELSTLQTPPSLSNNVLMLPKYPTLDLAGNDDKTYQLLLERE